MNDRLDNTAAAAATVPSAEGGRVLADALAAQGVDTVFLIPGTQLDHAVEGLRQRADSLHLVVPRHEQSTTYMADGYYRASGRPGVSLVVPGPGVLNAGAGLATAYASNSKLVFIAAQIHSTSIGAGHGNLHEIPGQSALIAGLGKWHRCVDAPDAINAAVDEAFVRVHEGRPRPVGLEIPFDFLMQSVPQQSSRVEPSSAPALDEEAIDRIAKLLTAARLPVLYVGGGAVSPAAAAAVQRLAEHQGLPVVMSDNGRGALSDRHPLAMTSLEGRALFAKADLVLVAGSRFMDIMTPTPSWTQPGPRFIHINLDASDLRPPRRPEIALQADLVPALHALADRLPPRRVLSDAEGQSLQQWARRQMQAVLPQAAYVEAMRRALPEDGIFVNELTQVGYLARIAFPVYGPQTYVGPGYQGTLGYGFPTALGAAVGGGGRRVLSITGDGGFGWNLQELSTAAKYRLPVTLVVFNDGHFGNVRAIQKRVFGHTAAVDLANPDYQLLARAFGVPSARVDGPEALEGALRDALSQEGPVLIEVSLGELPSPWHLLRLEPLPGVASVDPGPSPLEAL